jgi:AcrR family transcriptional regulator
VATRMKPEDRRELILGVAAEQFAEHGYRNLSMRQLAGACDMSAPGLMHYFPTVELLLEAVLERRDVRDLAAAATRYPADATFTERVRATIAHYRENSSEVHHFAIVEGEALDPRHPAHQFFRRRQQRNHDLMLELLEDHYDNAEELTFLLAAALEGLRWRWMASSPEFDPTESMIRAWEMVSRLGMSRSDELDAGGRGSASHGA